MAVWTLLLALVMFAGQSSDAVARRHVQRGYALAQSGDFNGAEAELRQAVKLAPEDPVALGVLGMVLSQQHRLEEANTCYERALKLDPSDTGTRYNLAANQVQLGRPDLAKVNLDRILNEKPEHKAAASLLAVVRARGGGGYEAALDQYRAGNFSGCQALLERMIAEGGSGANVFSLLAWSHHRQRHPKEALAAIRQAIEAAPFDAGLFSNAAQILLENGNLPAAYATVSKALELAPDNVQSLKLKGRMDLERNDLKQAAGTFARAVELDRTDPEALEWLGTAQRALFQQAQAAATFEKGITMFPRYARIYMAYAKLLLDSGVGRDASARTRAVTLLERALALDASLPEAHYELGRLLLDEGKASDALRHLQAAAKLDVNNSATHLALASAYRLLGQTEKQASELATYRELERQKALVTAE